VAANAELLASKSKTNKLFFMISSSGKEFCKSLAKLDLSEMTGFRR